MQREVRGRDEVRLDARGFGTIDAADAIAPAAMLAGIGFELGRRQVPAQAAHPGQRDGRHRRGQPTPFRHGADAQAKIGLGIAPAGIDPGEGAERRHAAGLAGFDDRDACAGRRQVPRDRSADDAGAGDDDPRRRGHGCCLSPLRAAAVLGRQLWMPSQVRARNSARPGRRLGLRSAFVGGRRL